MSASHDRDWNREEDLAPTDRTNGMLCHLLALAGYIIPFGHIIGPLIIWQMKKNESDYVDYHGRESLNFQISLTIYAMVSAVLILLVVGIFLLMAVGIGGLILTIIGAIKANEGERYRYPFCIRLL